MVYILNILQVDILIIECYFVELLIKNNTMKNLSRLISLIFCLTIGGMLNAQNSNDTYFTISLGNYADPLIENFADLTTIGHVYGEPNGGYEYTVYLGGFGNILESQAVVDRVKKMNYLNAHVVQKQASKGKQVNVVQIDMLPVGKEIDWTMYLSAGKLFTITEDNSIRLVTGVYADMAKANARTEALHRAGYGKAYVVNVNSIKLHEVSDFDMGVLDLNEPEAMVLSAPTPNSDVLVSKGNPTITASEAPPAARLIPRSDPPNIDGQIKRQSVQFLQKILTQLKSFGFEADGIYTPETDKAYNEQLSKNFKLKNYKAVVDADSDKINGFYLDWNDIKLLQTIAMDMSAKEVMYDEAQLKQLIWFHKKPSVLSVEDVQKLESWDYKLRKSLMTWEQKDAVYFEMVNAFKVTYFKSQILLEDFYMNKGFTLTQSRDLAIGALNTILAGSMDQYLEN